MEPHSVDGPVWGARWGVEPQGGRPSSSPTIARVRADAAAETDSLLAGLEGLARAALPRFGLAADAPLALIHHRENAVFRVDDPAEGRPFALRVHREGYRTAQEIRSELAFMDALREAGVATPRARPGVGGDPVQTVAVPGLAAPRDVDVLSWIEGAPLDVGAGERAYRLLGRHLRAHPGPGPALDPAGRASGARPGTRRRWSGSGRSGATTPSSRPSRRSSARSSTAPRRSSSGASTPSGAAPTASVSPTAT